MIDPIKILESIAADAENLSANALRQRCYESIRQIKGGTSRPLSRAKTNFSDKRKQRFLKPVKNVA